MKYKELMDDLSKALYIARDMDDRYTQGWVDAFVTFEHVIIDAFHREEMEKKNYQNGKEKPGNDPVNHPGHYTAGKIEVIDFLEDQNFPYYLGNAVKYISRAGKKDQEKTIEDLEKAIWYLKRYIGLLKKEKQVG